ncbi:MAG: efflux RND transporter periplasmic adaptor subunit [Planctomycetota bacterium]|jgi:RND family efflux transporter MFP subunit
MRRTIFLLLLLGGASFLGWQIYRRLQEVHAPKSAKRTAHAAPVAVEHTRRGAIELRRTFSGTLEAPDELVVAPKIDGRVRELTVDLADTVRRGQLVARLDADEHIQAVAQADADILVAKANLAEAKSALQIAERGLERLRTLREKKVASESQLDVAIADHLAKQAAVEVARARVKRAEAAHETARIRLGYTEIRADWTGGDEDRVVAQRHVDAGATVRANAQLFTILELDPLNGVVYVPERDYARLSVGQTVDVRTDAHADEVFGGTIVRIAPTFRRETRQARVELSIPNEDRRLKPGMFIRATVVLARVEDAVLMTAAALTKRDDRVGVFVVTGDGKHVRWQPLEIGIRDGNVVQVLDDGFSGRVVTLGQQLVDDGSEIVIPELEPERAE